MVAAFAVGVSFLGHDEDVSCMKHWEEEEEEDERTAPHFAC